MNIRINKMIAAIFLLILFISLIVAHLYIESLPDYEEIVTHYMQGENINTLQKRN